MKIRGRIYNIDLSQNNFLIVNDQNHMIEELSFLPDQKLNFRERDCVTLEIENGVLQNIIQLHEREKFLFDPLVHTKYHRIQSASCIDPSYLAENNIECGIADFNSVQSLSEINNANNIMPGCILNFYTYDYIWKYIKDTDRSFRSFKKIIVLDIETTSHNSLDGDIIEIGICEIINGEINLNLENVYFNTDIPITNFISQLTGINNELLNNKGREISHILNLFASWEEEDVIIVSYRKFDLSFLNKVAEKLLNRFLNINYLDCFELFKVCFPEVTKRRLSKFLEYNNIERKNAHRASSDAYYTAILIQKCFNQLDYDKPIKDLQHQNVREQFDLIIWAKNNSGLQKIYEMVGKDSIPLSNLLENKKDILIGCAADSYYVKENFFFQSYFIDREQFKNRMQILDYILIVPFEKFFLQSVRTYIGGFSNGEDNHMTSYNESIQMLGEKTIIKYYDILFSYFSEKILFSSRPLCIFPEEEPSTFYLSQNFISKRMNEFISSRAYMHTKKEVLEYFKNWKNIEYVVNNNENFLKKNLLEPIVYSLPSYEKIYPAYSNEEKIQLDTMLSQKLQRKYGFAVSQVYYRIEEEMKVLTEKNFISFFISISETVEKLKEKFNCIVGSRGSVGASFVAFILGITEVNPLPAHQTCFACQTFKWTPQYGSGLDNPTIQCEQCRSNLYRDGYDIDFSTFINPLSNSLPDIDLNIATFLHKSASKFIIEYIKQFNITCVKSSAILRIQNKNAKFYIYKELPNCSSIRLKFYTSLLQNIKLSVSQHPGGIFMFPSNISIEQFTPVQFSEGSDHEKVTHFDYYHMAKSINKFDLLAHEDPSTLQYLLQINNLKESELIIDSNIFTLFSNNKCTGIPEFGTVFGRRVCSEIKPKNFTELSKISGLIHGINVWSNNGKILFDEGKSINEIITTRDDIYTYLSNNTNIDRLDIVRIINIVKKGEINKYPDVWSDYEKLLLSEKVPSWWINSLKKMTYLFPKPHAVAYTLMAVKIAYFKMYHKISFFTSFFNRKQVSNNFNIDFVNGVASQFTKPNSKEQKYKVIEQIFQTLNEIKKNNIDISISWNHSKGEKACFIEGQIFLPFSSIKGFGKMGMDIEKLRDEENLNQLQIIKRLNIKGSKLDLLKQYKLYKHNSNPKLF